MENQYIKQFPDLMQGKKIMLPLLGTERHGKDVAGVDA